MALGDGCKEWANISGVTVAHSIIRYTVQPCRSSSTKTLDLKRPPTYQIHCTALQVKQHKVLAGQLRGCAAQHLHSSKWKSTYLATKKSDSSLRWPAARLCSAAPAFKCTGIDTIAVCSSVWALTAQVVGQSDLHLP